MPDLPIRRTALAERAASFTHNGASEPNSIGISECSGMSLLLVRGRSNDSSFSTAIRAALGFDLPTEPNTTCKGDGITALWLAPDRWLLLDRPSEGSAGVLRDRLTHLGVSIVDKSSGYSVFRISGGSARDLLAKSCPLDLHPKVFRPGACAQTLVAETSTLIHATEDGSLDLYVARSYGLSVMELLHHQAAEFLGGSA